MKNAYYFLLFSAVFIMSAQLIVLFCIFLKKKSASEQYSDTGECTLGVLCYFKNERHIMNEWLMHYKKWGADHIWLIDNGSEDDYNIDSFVREGFVTIYHEPNAGQPEAYRKYIKDISKQVHWLAVLDMDEFLYSRRSNNLISQLHQFRNKTAIKLQMKLFRPSTFLSPRSIIESCVYYKKDSLDHPKCIYNLKKTLNISVHGRSLEGSKTLQANNSYFEINHYRFHSIEFLYGIKEGRGGGHNRKRYALTARIHENFMNDLKSSNYREKDIFLRDHSNDVIQFSHENIYPPKLQLYPYSSFLKYKKLHPKIFDKWAKHEKELTEEDLIHILKGFLKLDV